MAHWNHRVVRQIHKGEVFYGVHEAFYDDDKLSWTRDAVSPIGNTMEELRETLERMLACLDKPVIEDTP